MENESTNNEDLLIKEVQQKDRIIDSLNRNIADLNNSNEELALHLLSLEKKISQSIVWNILTKVDIKLIKKFLPHGTYREKIFNDLLSPIKKLLNYNKSKLYKDTSDIRQTVNPGDEPKKEECYSASYYKAFFSSIIRNATIKSPYYENMKDFSVIIDKEDTRLIAFYLPQYHPIPENDIWWGKGFTDWINVAKAVPQFIGHYQPQLPDELGFYDLRQLEVLTRQIELARQYGIYGFCFHYYWFDGKRLLERPLNQFLAHKEITFPFCICWANENWTRRWDGHEDEVLIDQTYSQGFERSFIQELEPVLRDPRYIRINGKPVLIVYCAQNLPDAKATAAFWRKYCKEIGIGDLFLISAQTFNFHDPRALGFDAAVEFPPHNTSICPNITGNISSINPHFSGTIKHYPAIIHEKLFAFEPPYTLFKCIVPGWDNTARRINNPTILHGSSPALYKQWLIDTIKFTKNILKTGEQYVFINAWNEWAEGAHLEPDKKFGYSYLNVTAEALLEAGKRKSSKFTFTNRSGNTDCDPLKYSSFFNSLIWKNERLHYKDLSFRLESLDNQNEIFENDSLNLYKDETIISEYRHFWKKFDNFSARNVLEIGVWGGASLIFWYELFKPEKLVGIDIDKKELSKYYHNYIATHNLLEKIKIFWETDQKNLEFLRKIVQTEYIGPLDIVIDDGSHFYEETKISFTGLFPYLKPGGLYIIEDWSWSLWDQFKTSPYFAGKRSLMDLLTDCMKTIGRKNELIQSIHIYSDFVVIERSSIPDASCKELLLDDSTPQNTHNQKSF